MRFVLILECGQRRTQEYEYKNEIFRMASGRNILLISYLVAKDESEDSGQENTYSGLNYIEHIHKRGDTAN